MRSLADVVAYEDEHRDVEQPHFGHEHFTAAIAGGGRAGAAYAEARRRNLAWALEACLTPALEGADALVAPSYGPAWKATWSTATRAPRARSRARRPSPAGRSRCVPLGLVDGLPVGLAVVGRAGAEWTVLEVAARVERLVGALGAPAWRAPARG